MYEYIYLQVILCLIYIVAITLFTYWVSNGQISWLTSIGIGSFAMIIYMVCIITLSWLTMRSANMQLTKTTDKQDITTETPSKPDAKVTPIKSDSKSTQPQPQPQPPKEQQQQDQIPEPDDYNPPYSEVTDIHARWMEWKQDTQPLNQNTDQYKIYHGYYAGLQLRPGFHEKIVPSNQYQIDDNLSEITPISASVPTRNMTGGGDEGVQPSKDNLDDIYRMPDVIYSGDIIELSTNGLVLQRETNNSQVTMSQPLPKIRTNLSKLRFENLINNGPIRYQETVYIKHSAMVDNVNSPRHIKYGERVQSHQQGPVYSLFKLYDVKDPKNIDSVKYGDTLMIACGDQQGDKVYLKLESDKSISSESMVDSAIKFNVSLLQPYDQHILDIKIGETLYP